MARPLSASTIVSMIDRPARRGATRRRTVTPVVSLLVFMVTMACVASCSGSKELAFDDPVVATTTTTEDPLDAAELATGAAGIEELQSLFDRFLASDDTCAILTQRDVAENRLDPTLFASPAARRILADGLVQVYDHLIQISDPRITAALAAQKDVFAQVLDVVDRYAANPNNPGATDEIEDLVQSEGFLSASQVISAYVSAVCV